MSNETNVAGFDQALAAMNAEADVSYAPTWNFRSTLRQTQEAGFTDEDMFIVIQVWHELSNKNYTVD